MTCFVRVNLRLGAKLAYGHGFHGSSALCTADERSPWVFDPKLNASFMSFSAWTSMITFEGVENAAGWM